MVNQKFNLKNLRILFANGRMPHPFHIGGDGITLHTLLSFLHNHGAKCETLGVIDPKNAPLEQTSVFNNLNSLNVRYSWLYNENKIKTPSNNIISIRSDHRLSYSLPYKCTLVNRVNFFDKLLEIIHRLKPNLVLTQLEFSPRITLLAQELNIPIIFFVHDVFPENKWVFNNINEDKQLVFIVFNSKFTQSQLSNYSQYVENNNTILYPAIAEENYVVKRNTQNYITVIDPIKNKGGLILLEIAKKLPNIKFLAVKNWFEPQDDGVCLQDLPNVDLISRQTDMKRIYQQTRILLFPTLLEEGFGRVIAEAALNGIPTIASKLGGVPEAVGNGGLLIDNPKNIDQWLRAILKIETKQKIYGVLSSNARTHARQFTLKNTSYDFLKLINAYYKH